MAQAIRVEVAGGQVSHGFRRIFDGILLKVLLHSLFPLSKASC
jgi:hypothetical protein